jgi:hypothetical protein
MSLINIKLPIEEEYKKIVEQYVMIICSMLFMIILEPTNQFNSITFMLYNILGMLFFHLVFKKIVTFE